MLHQTTGPFVDPTHHVVLKPWVGRKGFSTHSLYLEVSLRSVMRSGTRPSCHALVEVEVAVAMAVAVATLGICRTGLVAILRPANATALRVHRRDTRSRGADLESLTQCCGAFAD
jgi:hypothetical protein